MRNTHARPIEWGSKARKQEVRDRGINQTDRRLAIEEQLAEDDDLWINRRIAEVDEAWHRTLAEDY